MKIKDCYSDNKKIINLGEIGVADGARTHDNRNHNPMLKFNQVDDNY